MQARYQQKIYPGDVYILKDLEYTNKHHDDLTSIHTVRYQRPCIIMKVNDNKTYGVIPLSTKDNENYSVYPMQIESHVQTFALLSNYVTVNEIQLGQFFSCLKPEVFEELTVVYTKYFMSDQNTHRTLPMVFNELDCVSLENWKYYWIDGEFYLPLRLINRNQVLLKVNEYSTYLTEQNIDFLHVKFVTSSFLRNITDYICVGYEFNEANRNFIRKTMEQLYQMEIMTKNINEFESSVFKMLFNIKMDIRELDDNTERYLKKLFTLIEKEKQNIIEAKFYRYIYSTDKIKKDNDIHIIIPYLLYKVNIFTCNIKVLMYMIREHPLVVNILLKPYRRVFYLNTKTNKLFDGKRLNRTYRIPNMYALHQFLIDKVNKKK